MFEWIGISRIERHSQLTFLLEIAIWSCFLLWLQSHAAVKRDRILPREWFGLLLLSAFLGTLFAWSLVAI
jgi:hypothetical protein